MNICYIPLFQLPQKKRRFSIPSLAHSELVHIFEGMFSEKSHDLLQSFAIFLPIILFSVMRNITVLGSTQ